jgi:hypothetical protein
LERCLGQIWWAVAAGEALVGLGLLGVGWRPVATGGGYASCGGRWWVWSVVIYPPLPILPRWGPWHSGGLLDGAAALTIGGRRWAGLAVPLPEVVAHGGRQRSAFEDGFQFVIAVVLR